MKLDKMLFDKYDGKDVSVYATTETIGEFIDLFGIELDNAEELDYVLNNEYVILSRVYNMFLDEEFWIIEPLGKYGNQYENECEVILAECSVVDAINFNKVCYNEFDIFSGIATYVEEIIKEKNDTKKYTNDWIDDVAEDLLTELTDLTDLLDTIKRYLRAIVQSTEKDIREKIVNEIYNYF